MRKGELWATLVLGGLLLLAVSAPALGDAWRGYWDGRAEYALAQANARQIDAGTAAIQSDTAMSWVLVSVLGLGGLGLGLVAGVLLAQRRESHPAAGQLRLTAVQWQSLMQRQTAGSTLPLRQPGQYLPAWDEPVIVQRTGQALPLFED